MDKGLLLRLSGFVCVLKRSIASGYIELVECSSAERWL